ncbi:bifunctional diaminohydroxyphosphoribosylaminopyrimidine deaminase/5-amino-6-(5-phosphoribosylamino)uracil reductase RibD [Yinghuangia seranimata]|uniref:bifunctional diaminohydroxyphosphoribosylaminopyrimidine deaminase/5-amino-6-(5-phosphoribosylamino)uracil reductase RibD n=1 Tax=Yinghuangia seranimata TaxID=408067 RepID=UPI00248A942A|nr:bifunctional diaminohydroxyphosphoribosylaminopyrimidine deaminase/5-amino-6-(5-phosphoribosylamino)uracil reductase RibD [Yinghuangia seranimata]MDI2126455.1 bifunctional diaminohydroxyphosphoribosylaminopyrimidine deaminase/5-amino-6-(5-phosphoribosylamino)uracil reductase RibD [Yinghuangia seranimata]
MRRAVALAARGLGTTSPNPTVGCVVLDAHGELVGEGFHEVAGGPHAEIGALRQAGERARGGTAYVTLEPCNHTGRTGPCSQALIDAGIARVVYAVSDPNPQAAGGAETLRAAGVAVEGGLLEAEAARGNEAWLTATRLGRPFTTWKYAATLDGRSAAEDGTSRWITSAASRADVHRIRAEVDAVVAGSGTLRADDPHLAVRLPEARTASAASGLAVAPAADEAGGAGTQDAPGTDAGRPARQPLRVVLDTRGTISASARVLDDAAPTLVAVADDLDDATAAALAARIAGRAEVLPLPRAADGAGLDLHALNKALYARGVRSVLLEGGPTLAGAYAAEGLVDKVVGYLAPALLGAGPAALGPAGITTIAQALRLHVDEVAAGDRFGGDIRVTAYPTANTPARPQTADHPAKEI